MQLREIDLDGPVTYADHGGPDDGPPIVLVHGLGASQLSWWSLAPLLARRHRVIAVDLLGSGGSAPLGRAVGVHDNRIMLSRLIGGLFDRPVTLVGNSMGGAVAALTAHASPSLVDHMVLLSPAVPVTPTVGSALRSLNPVGLAVIGAYAVPGVGSQVLRLRRARMSPQRSVEIILDTVCADPSAVDPALVDMLIAQAAQRRDIEWADQAFLQASRSVVRLVTAESARYRTILRTLGVPTLLLHGQHDALVPVTAARKVAATNPQITFAQLDGLGHAPQLEAPELLADLIEDRLDTARRSAA